MEINRWTFPTEYLRIAEEIAESHFVSFDLEFSGIASRQPQRLGKLSLQDVYTEVREAALNYQILQVGITVVKEDLERGCYVARPYNFNINPIPFLKERYIERLWSYQSGAVNFLINNGFNFQLPLTEGIAYLSKQEEGKARSKWIDDDTRKSGLPDLDIKQDEVALVDHLRVSVSRWQQLCDPERPSYLNIPHDKPPKGVPKSLSRYQLRLVHQVIQNEFPGLKTMGMKGFVQITDPTDEERANESSVLERRREEDIGKAVGFRWLIDALAGKPISRLPDKYVINAATTSAQQLKDEAPLVAHLRELQERLSSRRKILVGHNCFTDLVNLYACFIGEPPESIGEFCSQIHELFPAIIDTKYLASSGRRGNNTALAEVELDLRSQSLPLIELPCDFDRYDVNEKYHEAGYDSFLTAKLMIKLAANLYQDGKSKASHEDNVSDIDFGRDDHDEYVTAAESLTDSDSASTNALRTVAGVLSTPVTAVKALFGLDSAEASKTEENPAQIQNQGSESLSPPPKKVVAIRQKPVDWSRAKEVKAVKSAFATANIFEALKEDSSASSERHDDDAKDLMSFSDREECPRTSTMSQAEEVELPPPTKTLIGMVEEGEIMPRWDDSQFWATFGNKLQVNPAQERVLKLV